MDSDNSSIPLKTSIANITETVSSLSTPETPTPVATPEKKVITLNTDEDVANFIQSQNVKELYIILEAFDRFIVSQTIYIDSAQKSYSFRNVTAESESLKNLVTDLNHLTNVNVLRFSKLYKLDSNIGISGILELLSDEEKKLMADILIFDFPRMNEIGRVFYTYFLKKLNAVTTTV